MVHLRRRRSSHPGTSLSFRTSHPCVYTHLCVFFPCTARRLDPVLRNGQLHPLPRASILLRRVPSGRSPREPVVRLIRALEEYRLQSVLQKRSPDLYVYFPSILSHRVALIRVCSVLEQKRFVGAENSTWRSVEGLYDFIRGSTEHC